MRNAKCQMPCRPREVIGNPPCHFHFPSNQKQDRLDSLAMMISFWKPIISISLFLTLTVLAADEFILEEDGIIQIECGDDDPASICGLNGEVENQRSYAPEGTYTVTHGNGVCIGCDTNQQKCSCPKQMRYNRGYSHIRIQIKHLVLSVINTDPFFHHQRGSACSLHP